MSKVKERVRRETETDRKRDEREKNSGREKREKVCVSLRDRRQKHIEIEKGTKAYIKR
jgi:hypothetical protein